MRPIFKFIIRLLLGALLLPIFLIALMIFTLAAICADRRLLPLIRIHPRDPAP